MKNWMQGYKPDPNCRSCDGTGVFYGNVCPCGCLRSEKTGELITQEKFDQLDEKYNDNQ